MLRPSDHVRALTVRISDPAPGAEKFLSGFVAAAWPSLARLSPLPAEPPWAALSFHAEPEAALAGAEFVQESAPEREELKRALLARLDAVLDPEIVIASSSSGLLMSRVQIDCLHPELCVIGHPFNPPHLVPLVEVVGSEKAGPRGCRAGARLLHRDRQAADSHPPRGSRACRQPAAAGVVAGGGASGGRTGGERRRRRYGDQRRVGAALGLDGAASDLSPRRRGWRHR